MTIQVIGNERMFVHTGCGLNEEHINNNKAKINNKI